MTHHAVAEELWVSCLGLAGPRSFLDHLALGQAGGDSD